MDEREKSNRIFIKVSKHESFEEEVVARLLVPPRNGQAQIIGCDRGGTEHGNRETGTNEPG